MVLPHTQCRGQRQHCFAERNKHMTPHDKMSSEQQRFLARSHRITLALPAIHSASRATPSELVVGLIRTLCNGLCISRHFHSDEDDQTCRLGCQDLPECLGYYNECPCLATVLPDSGGVQAFGYETIFSSTISSHKLHAAVFKKESLSWACLMRLCTHVTVTAMTEKTPETFKIAWEAHSVDDRFDAS